MCDHDDKMQHRDTALGRILAQMGNKAQSSQLDRGQLSMAGTHSLSLTHTHSHTPIALPKDLTCGLQSTTRSVPTSPAPGHQTAGTDGQWSRNEGKQGLPGLALVRWWSFGVNHPTVTSTGQGYPLSPLTVPNSGKSNVQFYPAGTYPGPQATIT